MQEHNYCRESERNCIRVYRTEFPGLPVRTSIRLHIHILSHSVHIRSPFTRDLRSQRDIYIIHYTERVSAAKLSEHSRDGTAAPCEIEILGYHSISLRLQTFIATPSQIVWLDLFLNIKAREIIS
jgi:hypothetical protein